MDHYEFNWRTGDGCQLFMQSWTPDAEPRAAVCLVHGLGEHSGRYAHVAAALVDAGYALLAFDLRGHGRSEGVRGHAESYGLIMEDIGGLLEKARLRYPGKPCFLYGHSLGGALVLNYILRCRPARAAAAHPDEGLAGVVVTGPGLRPAFDPPAWKMTMARAAYNMAPTMLVGNGLDVSGLSHDPAVIRAYKADPLVHDRVSARLGLDILSTGQEGLAGAARFPPIPLLIMHGTADRIASVEASRQFAAKVPGECTLKLWEGYYHELHNEPQRADVLAYVVSWLNAQLPA